MSQQVRSEISLVVDGTGKVGESRQSIGLLLVDDEIDLVKSLARVFSRRGMDVTTATSGAEALQIVRERSFDVAVIDIKMPEMDGIELLDRLKLRCPRLEIIILTGQPSLDTVVRSTVLGAYEYTRKPPDLEELSALIRRAFEKQKRLREAERLADLRQAREETPIS